MTKTVLGIRIDDVPMEEGLEIVESWLNDSGQAFRQAQGTEQSRSAGMTGTAIRHSGKPEGRTQNPKLVFTPGPEFLVTAQKDPEFKKILNSSDLNVPDGMGLRIFGGIRNVTPGVDLMLAICQLAAEKGWTIGLLGGREIVAQKTREKLEKKYPGIKIVFAIDGQKADRLIEDYDALRYVDILFVGLGHPKQEKFLSVIARNPSISLRMTKQSHIYEIPRFTRDDKIVPFCVGMGVGGSFDFISGKVPQPPQIIQKLGLKWLARFLSNPAYMSPKIFRAVVVFPLLLLKEKKFW